MILTGLAEMKSCSGMKSSISDLFLLAEGGSTGGAGWMKGVKRGGAPGMKPVIAGVGNNGRGS